MNSTAECDRKAQACLDQVGECLLRRQYTVAVLIHLRALIWSPTYYEGWYGLACCYDLSKRWENAIHAWQKALGLRPYSHSAWCGLLHACGQLGGRRAIRMVLWELKRWRPQFGKEVEETFADEMG